MMKKGLNALLAALILLALAMTGCPAGDDVTETPATDTKSADTALRGITLASGHEATWGRSDDNKATPDAASFTPVNVGSADKTNAEVTLRTQASNYTGTIRVGKEEGGTINYQPYSSSAKPKFSLVDGDKLIVEMTAENGTRAYYGANVRIGWDASLKSILFEEENAVEEFGTPAATLAGVTAPGYYLLPILQPSDGFNIAVTANDSLATVTFGKASNAETTWTPAAKIIKFDDGEFLGVKVVSENGQVTSYYKISVELQSSMEIPYGTPKLYNTDDNSDTNYVDPLWEDITWIPVARQNRAETDDEFFENPSTAGRAKLYWDVDGLWLYVDVTTQYISTNTGYNHAGSSVELFINEGYPTVNSGNFNNIGGQYRLDSWGAVSGDPTAAANAMTALDRFKTFKTAGGYAVIFQAPWRFASQYKIEEGKDKDISLEIQINAANAEMTGRVGVLKWYNTIVNTYQNAAALAPGKLLAVDELPAQMPGITTQPVAQKVNVGTAAADLPVLTVVGASPDGGTLGYQWYKAAGTTAAPATDTKVGTNAASYTPDVDPSIVADHYYYVIVSNTKNGETKYITSSVVGYRIVDPSQTPVDIELVKAGAPGWDSALSALVFEKSGGWSNYSGIPEAILPIVTAFDGDSYARIELIYTGYKADGTQITSFGNQYGLDFGPRVFNNGSEITAFNNNASGATADSPSAGYVTSSWNFTAANDMTDAPLSSGNCTIQIFAMNKTNSGTDIIEKLVITSLKLVAK